MQLKIEFGSIDQIHSVLGFELQKVRETNLYIGIKKNTFSFANTCKCPNRVSGKSDLDKYYQLKILLKNNICLDNIYASDNLSKVLHSC